MDGPRSQPYGLNMPTQQISCSFETDGHVMSIAGTAHVQDNGVVIEPTRYGTVDFSCAREILLGAVRDGRCKLDGDAAVLVARGLVR